MRKKSRRRKIPARLVRFFQQVTIAVCILVIACGSFYIIHWHLNRSRIREDSERYRGLYTAGSAETAVPAATAIPTEAPAATAAPTPAPTQSPTQAPTATPAPTATATPAPTATATPAPTPEPTATPVPAETSAPASGEMPEVSDLPTPAPEPGAVIMLMPTPPPVQDSFRELLSVNPETIGFLQIADIVSLPVVQRENDNDYYLGHTFEHVQSPEGTLFLDGLNRLVPEDDCLIIYGHNMHNGTMFGNLRMYLNPVTVKNCPVIRFDTIYENRRYAVFAAFNASVNPADAHYFDVRQFLFTEDSFNAFVSGLRSLSAHDIPLDVRYGDRLLLLVTCDYSNDNGRFILALRELRDGETVDGVSAIVTGGL